MKDIIQYSIIAAILFALGCNGCKKEPETTTDPVQLIEEIVKPRQDSLLQVIKNLKSSITVLQTRLNNSMVQQELTKQNAEDVIKEYQKALDDKDTVLALAQCDSLVTAHIEFVSAAEDKDLLQDSLINVQALTIDAQAENINLAEKKYEMLKQAYAAQGVTVDDLTKRLAKAEKKQQRQRSWNNFFKGTTATATALFLLKLFIN